MGKSLNKNLGRVFCVEDFGPEYLAFGPRYADFGPRYSDFGPRYLDTASACNSISWFCSTGKAWVQRWGERGASERGGGRGGQVKANHGFGTDPQQSDGTDDRIDHTATPDHKTSADQTADIDQM